MVARRPSRRPGFFARNHIKYHSDRYDRTHPPSLSCWFVDVGGTLGVVPSTLSHVMQSLAPNQIPVIPCSASFCGNTYEETLKNNRSISRCLNCFFTLPPISATTFLQHTHSVFTNHLHAWLATPISLPTRPTKPHPHPKVSPLEQVLCLWPHYISNGISQ